MSSVAEPYNKTALKFSKNITIWEEPHQILFWYHWGLTIRIKRKLISTNERSSEFESVYIGTMDAGKTSRSSSFAMQSPSAVNPALPKAAQPCLSAPGLTVALETPLQQTPSPLLTGGGGAAAGFSWRRANWRGGRRRRGERAA